MRADWKARLTSRRTLGRLIRFELLVALIFGIAGLAMLFVPQPKPTSSRAVAAGAVAAVAAAGECTFALMVCFQEALATGMLVLIPEVCCRA